MSLSTQACLTRAICSKALRVDKAATDATMAEITNLLAVDANNVMTFSPGAAWLFLEGAQLLCTLGVLYGILGVAALGGLGVTLLLFPINVVVMRRIKVLQEQLMTQKDERMARVTEAVSAIRSIKIHHWEDVFERRVAVKRDDELATLWQFQTLTAVTSTLWIAAPTMAAMSSFLLKSLVLGEDISPAQGFTSLTLFQLLTISLTFLPSVINQAIQAKVGIDRIDAFLRLPEVSGRNDGHQWGLACGAITVRGGTFMWSRPVKDDDAKTSGAETAAEPLLDVAESKNMAASEEERPSSAAPHPALVDVTLNVSPCDLLCVYGPTGCGKSTLLSALLGDVQCAAGVAAVGGTVSYVPQHAWVCNATLRENILFGAPLDAARYDAVLAACALTADIATLPAGDLTEIGERGVNLSGGQQQRVGLARACYAKSDVILLDDVLSALDAHVAQHVFEKCICSLLRDRTRVLVTHAASLTLTRADRVVVLGPDGTVLAEGSPSADAPAIVSLRRRSLSSSSLTALAETDATKTASIAETNKPISPVAMPDATSGDVAQGTITRKEERARGAAAWSVYAVYLRACGGWRFAAVFLPLCVVYSAMNPIQSVALESWMDAMEDAAKHDDDPAYNTRAAQSARVYAACASGFIMICLIRNVCLPFASVSASRMMHADMTRSVLRATLAWFDATPLGRVLNRFSSDIAAIDKDVASQFKDALVVQMNVLASGLVCILGTGQLASQLVVVAAVLTTIFASSRVFGLYRVAARELKRLDSVTKSPLLASFTEMVSGVEVVRAFGQEPRFTALSNDRCDDANRALFYLWVTNQWLRVSMNLVGSVVTATVAGAVLWQCSNLGDGAAGLTLSYATQFTQTVMWAFRLSTQLEVSMNDVERVDEYSHQLPLENYISGDATPSSAWPSQGAIVFQRVELKYPTASCPVFTSLSFTVAPRTRVGVVGRTAAGKSSLVVALLRLVEPSSGGILIDGIDISHVHLGTLRARLSLIAQQATLFKGTVRYNLAPGEDDGGARTDGDAASSADTSLWDVLERAGIAAKVRSLDGGLDAALSEGGSNLSAGEQQLLCMARALLRRRSILIMDEATASIDHDTDARIQKMIQRDFCGTTTVLTIAHRLHTIAYYDRVLVLARGDVVEYDRPAELLRRNGGAFKALAEESGDFGALLEAADAATAVPPSE